MTSHTEQFDLDAVRQLAESVEFTEPDLYAALAAACDEIEELRNYMQGCLDPAPDEQHCACVPGLRREIERLKAALRKASDMLAPVMGETCPQCAALILDPQDHARGCGLAAVLEQIDAALEAQP